ncbi:LOW QUALITY PROTEIN: Dimer_Tnp_hAT domain-containing protein, partial [Cephalotus follicularis]
IAEVIAIDKLQTRSGLNQIHYLQRSGDSRCGSHLNSLCSLITAIDSQLQEINIIFNESAMELIALCSALDPRDCYKFFKVDDACKLAYKYYPDDFTVAEKSHLIQLNYYEFDVPNHPIEIFSHNFKTFTHIGKDRKFEIYDIVFKLIRFVLTLPVSTATIERSFSAMKIVKSRLRNKMKDEYLADYLVTYVEKIIAIQFSTYSIIDDFYDIKEHR